MNNGRPYLDHQTDEVQPAYEHRMWVGFQASKGVYDEPAATEAYLMTARVSPSQPRVQHDNEEFRATRSPGSKILGVRPELNFAAEGYLQPAGALTLAATLDAGDDPPQGDEILRQWIGACSLCNSQNSDTFLTVITSTRDTTVFTVANSALYAVDDFIEFVSHADNASQSEPADCEVRRVTGIDVGGANRVTVSPGFSCEPIVTGNADTFRGVRKYSATKNWFQWLSGRILEGAIGKQLTDGKCGSVAIAFSPTEPIKITCDLTFMSMLRSGIDQVMGESGSDSFLAGDTVLDVADASKFEVGSYVDLHEVDVAADTVAAVLETAAEVTARNTVAVPNTLTLVRGGGVAVACTDLTARTTTMEEQAGPNYDVSVKTQLKFKVDRQQFVEFDVTSPTAPMTPTTTAAVDIVTNLNTQLRLHQYYGFNVGGAYAVTWGTGVFVDNGGVIEMHSKMFGSQSMVQVVDTGNANSADDELFVGPFEITAVEECQIHPHDITTTEQGVEEHGYTFILNLGGYQLGVNTFSISQSNAPRVVREMKNTPNPLSIIAGRTRVYDISLELLQRQDAARFYQLQEDETEFILHGQTQEELGYIFGFDAPLAKILTVVTGGDAEVTNLTLTIGIRGTAEDEIDWYCG